MWNICGLRCCPYDHFSLMVPCLAIAASILFTSSALHCQVVITEDDLHLGFWKREGLQTALDGVTMEKTECDYWDSDDDTDFDFIWTMGRVLSALGTLTSWVVSLMDAFLLYTPMPIGAIRMLMLGTCFNAGWSALLYFLTTDSDVCKDEGCRSGRGIELALFAFICWLVSLLALCCISGMERRGNQNGDFVRGQRRMQTEQDNPSQHGKDGDDNNKDNSNSKSNNKSNKKKKKKKNTGDDERDDPEQAKEGDDDDGDDSRGLPTTVAFVDKNEQDKSGQDKSGQDKNEQDSGSQPRRSSRRKSSKRKSKRSGKAGDPNRHDTSTPPSGTVAGDNTGTDQEGDQDAPPLLPLPPAPSSDNAPSGQAKTPKQKKRKSKNGPTTPRTPRRKKSGASSSSGSSFDVGEKEVSDDASTPKPMRGKKPTKPKNKRSSKKEATTPADGAATPKPMRRKKSRQPPADPPATGMPQSLPRISKRVSLDAPEAISNGNIAERSNHSDNSEEVHA